MRKCLFFMIPMAAFLYSCAGKQTAITGTATHFKSIEISYKHGWLGGGFTFIADSLKIYFVSQSQNTALYGILPDTIFNLVDSVAVDMRGRKITQAGNGVCFDCSVMALKMISGNDTMRITQAGNIDNKLLRLAGTLEKFIKEGRHGIMQAVILSETRLVVSPPPPKIGEDKLKPPAVNRKAVK